MKFFIFLITSLISSSLFSMEYYPVDEIKVIKSKHLMIMYFQKKVTMTYKVMLGRGGKGPKREEGDNKVPEGKYILDYQNPNSKFYKSLHVSYPNQEDIERAKKDGVDPGKDIMIHGMPNRKTGFESWMYDLPSDFVDAFSNPSVEYLWFPRIDWTKGCIALSNEMMEEVYRNVKIPTPITIVH